MQIQPSQRKRARIKMALQGPSGSGKTYSSILLAYGICNDWNKIAIIDTENESSHLYAHLGEYSVLSLSAPFTPEKYIEAITLCEQAGMEVIIIDSVSHEWQCLLDYHSTMQGNSFTNWGKVTPRQDSFITKLLQSPAHIIATVRTKQDYILSEKNGKMVPEKVGLKAIQRDGLDYEFTLVFDLDIKNNASASKDRTGLFFGKSEQKINISTGKTIAEWCNSGVAISIDDVSKRIGDTSSIKDLLALFQQYPQYKEILKPEFEQRKRQILIHQEVQTELSTNQNQSTNGVQ